MKERMKRKIEGLSTPYGGVFSSSHRFFVSLRYAAWYSSKTAFNTMTS